MAKVQGIPQINITTGKQYAATCDKYGQLNKKLKIKPVKIGENVEIFENIA